MAATSLLARTAHIKSCRQTRYTRYNTSNANQPHTQYNQYNRNILPRLTLPSTFDGASNNGFAPLRPETQVFMPPSVPVNLNVWVGPVGSKD